MPEDARLPVPPAIDYTNKDYASIRQALLDLAAYRVPEWTDRSPADPGMLLLDLFAYMGDILAYYQDRIASESFLHTATERRSVLHLLRLIGYELKPAVAATADLTLTFNAPAPNQPTVITVPSGAQFSTKAQGATAAVMFEYLEPDRTFDLSKSLVLTGLPVRQASAQPVETFSATGEPAQRFALSKTGAIPALVDVVVTEAGMPTTWTQRENFLHYTDAAGKVQLSKSDSRDYILEVDENGRTYIVFGDGVYGRPPLRGSNNIRVSYRVGVGAAGNVPPKSIVDAKTKIANLKSVTNPQAAGGGADRESLDHAIRFGPLAFRSGKRAVTLSDYISLAHEVGGVAKVHAVSRGWNRIELFVGPEGNEVAKPADDLKKRLVAYFNDKRMAGTFVYIRDPVPAGVTISISIIVEHNYNPQAVSKRVDSDVRALLDYKRVSFGQTLYISKIYEAAEAVPGVFAANVTRFQRTGERSDLPADGRLLFGDTEIPKIDDLRIRLEGEPA